MVGGVGDLRSSHKTSAAGGNSQGGSVVFAAPGGRVPAAQGFASTRDGALLVLQMRRASSHAPLPADVKDQGGLP